MMPPKGRKHCRSLHSDVLSNLPDNVIDVILICLPCIDAVRTSILSKKWRYTWRRCTKLTLDESHWRTKTDLLFPSVRFNKIIYQYLTLHEGPITEFTLNIDPLKRCPKIDNFIYFLSRNDIQHLVLHLPNIPGKKLYKLPSSLFTCSLLRHLTLRNCSLRPPSAFKGFDRLISLKLCRVTISSKLLGRLISHCPLLEQLVLEISKVRNIIEINSLSLRSFDFTGSISCVRLKNVPLLVKVSLIGDGSSMEAENPGFAQFFESCSSIEQLLFNYCYNEWAIDYPNEVATRLPFDLYGVKRFYVPNIVLEETYKFARALCLIRSFPLLEYLEIEIANEYDTEALEWLEMERFSDVTFHYLREVKLKCFTGTTPEMQLLKLLLAKSPVLLKMLIDHWILDAEIFAEVSKLLRASAKAEVVYKSLI